MIECDTIVVGGGPAGSTCAWKLREGGRDVIVLDREEFPRTKPCAGWITPRVLRDLRISAGAFPHNLVRFNTIHLHTRRHHFVIPTRQYAVRRIEFDDWLLRRAGVPVHRRTVTRIRREAEWYILDDAYRCRSLVGAGGTHCPVRRQLFLDGALRREGFQITAMEDEFEDGTKREGCHLWFSHPDLGGYAWFVRKNEGYVNVGIGGKTVILERGGGSIRGHWDRFVKMLVDEGFINATPPHPRGHVYYLRQAATAPAHDRAYLVGDAAGLATLDLGEGIGPAVRSGIRAAEAILRGREFSLKSVSKYSVWDFVFPWRA